MADIFRCYDEAYRAQHDASLSTAQRRVITAIELCRTAALGGHVEACDQCGHRRIAFNSCRDRPLPPLPIAGPRTMAGGSSRRASRHGILPRRLHAAGARCRHCLSEQGTRLRPALSRHRGDVADDRRRPRHLGAEIGFFAVLHTWGQNLLHHPHLHCVVPGGGLSADGDRWVPCKPGFFLPVRVLSRLFRRLFLEHLEKAFDAG
ncbi:transposase [Mesorhizobium sp. M0130]